MKGWEVKKWKTVLEIKNGRSQKQVVNPVGHYPIYGSGGEIMGYADDYICNEGTTIIGRKGTINRPIYIEEKFWNVDTAFGLSPFDCLNSKFLYYFCLGYDFTKHDKGTTLPSLTKNDLLNNVFIPLPPLEEQKRIVAILDEAFEGIDVAIANTQKNLANARELFESYLNGIFTRKGDGWVEKKLDSISNKVTVGHVGSMKSKYKDSGTPFLRSQNVLPFQIQLNNIVYIDENFNQAIKKSQLQHGDVVIVRTGYPGTAAVIPQFIKQANCSDLVIVRPGRVIKPEFLCLFFNSIIGKTMVIGNLVGAAQKHFNVTTAKEVLIPFPSLPEQDNIISKFNELILETQRLETIYQRKLEALQELKQSILQKAFTGELTSDTVKETAETSKEAIA